MIGVVIAIDVRTPIDDGAPWAVADEVPPSVFKDCQAAVAITVGVPSSRTAAVVTATAAFTVTIQVVERLDQV